MRLRHFCVVVGAALVMLTGCTPDLGLSDSPASAASSQSTTPQQSSSPHPSESDIAVTRADLPEMARITADAGARDAQESAGGTVTAILRSVEAAGDVLTVNFAIQWDDAVHKDTATAKDAALGLELSTIMVIDPSTLTGYRPFCTKGSYQGGSLERQDCLDSMLVSPQPESFMGYDFPNHGLIEGFAQLPVPQGHPAAVNVSLGSPFSMFTNTTVTYQ